jgi:hypothetical protein
MTPTPTEQALQALRELVALKAIKEECLRVRQRRPQSVTRRFPQDLLDAEADYKRRKPIAWDAARAAIAALEAAPTGAAQPVTVAYMIRARYPDGCEVYLDQRGVYDLGGGKVGIDVQIPEGHESPMAESLRGGAAQASEKVPTTAHGDLKWPIGYCLDPDGRMCVPYGQDVAWNFGYEIGFREAMDIKMRAVLPARATPPAEPGAEVPMPTPDGYAAMTPGGTVIVPPMRFKDYNAYAIFTADQLRTYGDSRAAAAVAADRAGRMALTDEFILDVTTNLFPCWREDIQDQFVLRVVRAVVGGIQAGE